MSQQELDRGDLEVMGMVNGHSTPEASAAAEEIAEMATAPKEEEVDCDLKADREWCCEAEKRFRKNKRIATLQLVLSVTVCLCVAAALIAAWYVPALLIWVVNVGVLACGIAAAMKIEKYIRWWR